MNSRLADSKEKEIRRLCSKYPEHKDLIDDLRAIADFYHREAEKNLRLLNEARGVVWHSVADELPSENGTYLVVGKSGKVFITHFYKERKLEEEQRRLRCEVETYGLASWLTRSPCYDCAGGKDSRAYLYRPPQSWCYVEELS